VDVDRLAQMPLDHRRAFDVPAGTAAAPGRVPADGARRRGLPQDEVGRVLLVRGNFHAGAGDHRVAVAAAERAVIGIAGHVEKDVAFRLIGVAGLDQARGHRDHVVDMFGRVRRDVRRGDAERAHIVEIMLLVAGGDHRRIDASSVAALMILSSTSVTLRA
jgi:hypothetical protein